ncbi:MAG: radical SAM protein, partial [Coriobacteriia bacterium]|nr:radical SAM protein [Coriobacteriia bacterium]
MSNDENRPNFDEIDEQAMADAMVALEGCGVEGAAIPLQGKGMPPGHPPLGKGMTTGKCPHGHGNGSKGAGSARQRHGGARSVGFRPGGGPEAIAYQERTGVKAPRIIAWEITRSCNLNCVHCRAASRYGTYEGELSLDEIKKVIDNIVTISNPIIILTGGEPLLRDDIWDIIDYCHEKGAMPVVGTNATMITPEIAE